MFETERTIDCVTTLQGNLIKCQTNNLTKKKTRQATIVGLSVGVMGYYWPVKPVNNGLVGK